MALVCAHSFTLSFSRCASAGDTKKSRSKCTLTRTTPAVYCISYENHDAFLSSPLVQRVVHTVINLHEHCVHAAAEEAFKRLSEAYECLVEETSQRNYLRTLLSASSHRAPKRPPPPTGPAAYPRKHKKKKKKQEEQQPQEPLFATTRRRRRTPEEIWKAFQEEEERLAREEFLSNGFERTYASSSSSRGRSTAGDSKPSVDVELQETILSSDLDEKARGWVAWRKSSSSSASPPQVPAANGASDASESSRPADAKPELICCLLCQRKFPSHEAFDRHKAFSKLHLANLQQN